jgi:hypothetical protein
VLAAAARRPVRLGNRCDDTGSPELLGNLASAVECGAAGEIAGNAARSGDVSSGEVLARGASRRGAGVLGAVRPP